MGNLCAIFHSRFKDLMKVIPSARQAQLMDYLLLGWQTSTYRLKNSEHKWFMKPYSEIMEDTHISESSLQRYIKGFADAGFIVRRQALYSRTEGEGGFTVKNGTYISITEKLLSLLTYPPNPLRKRYLTTLNILSLQTRLRLFIHKVWRKKKLTSKQTR